MVYCIIAHIDHGKSTLADRLLRGQTQSTVAAGHVNRPTFLDNMEWKRERGEYNDQAARRGETQMVVQKAADGENYHPQSLIDSRPGPIVEFFL